MSVASSASFSRFTSDCDLEEFSRDIFENAWLNFSSSVDDIWVDSLEVPITTDITMQKIRAIVNLATFCHDGTVSAESALEHIEAECEPTPTPIDNWARGAVPIRQLATSEDLLFKGDVHSGGTRTPSVSSFRSSATGSSKSSSRSGTHRNISRGAMKSDFHDTAPKIIELDEYNGGHGDAVNASGTGHMYEMLQRANNRLKKQIHTDDDVEDEFATLEGEVKRAAAEFKGKKYAFDHTGRPIVINTVNPDSLPPYAYQPGLNISFDSSSSDAGKKDKKKGKKKIRVAGSRSVDHPQFVPTASLATALSSHTHISLNPGVAIKSGETMREGPARADDPKKPSRKEFFNRQSLSSTTGSLDMGSEWMDKSAVTNTLSESSKIRTSGESLSRSGDKLTGIPSKHRYPDIDPMEGAREVTQQASRVETQQTEEVDETQSLQKHAVPGSKTRGSGKQPIKPSDKQKEIIGLLHGGPELAGPRDRLSHQTLDSRRKISFAPTSTSPQKDLYSPSDSTVKHDSFASATTARSQGGSVKKDRPDIASAIF